MDYLVKMKAQKQIKQYQEILRDRISTVDSEGNRKLNSRYFLSGEVAAYKILSSWIKRMYQGEDVVDENIETLLACITNIVYESYLNFEEYEENSFYCWKELMLSFGNESLRDFNRILFALSTLAELESGAEIDDVLINGINETDLLDAGLTAYAYTVAHDYLISKSDEELQRFAESGFGINGHENDLYKLHFNLFQ